MNKFFDDLQAFRKALQTKTDGGTRCWSCSGKGRRLRVSFNVHKDLTSLGVDPEACAPAVSLCRTCAAAYMNSFNRALARQQGREGPTEVWTVES